METIQSAGLLKKAFSILFNGLDSIFNEAIKDAKIAAKEVTRGGKLGARYTYPLADHPDGYVVAELYPVSGTTKYYIFSLEGKGETSDGKPIDFEGAEWKPVTLEGDDILSVIQKFIDEHGEYGVIGGHGEEEPEESEEPEEEKEEEGEADEKDAEANPEDVEENKDASPNACKQVSAKIRKICGSEEVELLAINANCYPNDAVNMLCDLIDSGEISNITEEPMSLQITETPEGTSVEQIEEVDISDVVHKLFCKLVQVKNNIITIGLACPSVVLETYDLRSMVRDAAKMEVRLNNVYPNESCCGCDGLITLDHPLSDEEAYQMAIDNFHELIDFCEVYSVCFSASDQQQINNWVAYLKDAADYLLKSHITAPTML